MTDLSGLLFPIVDLASWCDTHKLGMDTTECPHCGRDLNPKTPCATPDYRGFLYEECCDNTPILFGAADPVQRQKDREFAQTLIGALQ